MKAETLVDGLLNKFINDCQILCLIKILDYFLTEMP